MERKKERDEKKRVAKIYSLWKRLIHGIMVKHHVRETYGGGSDESEEETAPTAKKKQVKKSTAGSSKKKVTQKDLDEKKEESEKKEVVEKVQLGIDFSSDTVIMAKKSYKSSVKSKHAVSYEPDDETETKAIKIKEEILSDCEDSQENIKSVLAWNDSKICGGGNLSDDSDADDSADLVQSDADDLPDLNQSEEPITVQSTVTNKRKANRKKISENARGSESETDKASTSKPPAKSRKITKKVSRPAKKVVALDSEDSADESQSFSKKSSAAKKRKLCADTSAEPSEGRRSSRRSVAKKVEYVESNEELTDSDNDATYDPPSE